MKNIVGGKARDFWSIFQERVSDPTYHDPSSAPYTALYQDLESLLREGLGGGGELHLNFPVIGDLRFPYVKMGQVDSVHAFALFELFLFHFYLRNQSFYRKVADLGANLGVHSIIMARLGWSVTAYEPDPEIFEHMRRNVCENGVQNRVVANQAAVSDTEGYAQFTRVLDNRTASHLTGAKNGYGPLEHFTVPVVSFVDVLRRNELLKIDVEGVEAALICQTRREDWDASDCFLEISSEDSRDRIFDHLMALGVRIYPQKTVWEAATTRRELPTSHREGNVFISARRTPHFFD